MFFASDTQRSIGRSSRLPENVAPVHLTHWRAPCGICMGCLSETASLRRTMWMAFTVLLRVLQRSQTVPLFPRRFQMNINLAAASDSLQSSVYQNKLSTIH